RLQTARHLVCGHGSTDDLGRPTWTQPASARAVRRAALLLLQRFYRPRLRPEHRLCAARLGAARERSGRLPHAHAADGARDRALAAHAEPSLQRPQAQAAPSVQTTVAGATALARGGTRVYEGDRPARR